MENSNSGVEGGSGYSFQRCCVIYLLLQRYSNDSYGEYFVCLEHHEDFLFAILDADHKIKKINTYQAKKSRNSWGITKDFSEIIDKILLVGCELDNDKTPKSATYRHVLNFITNNSIKLKSDKKLVNNLSKDVKKSTVQVSNIHVRYKDLHKDIQSNITTRVTADAIGSSQLDNLSFIYVDLPQGRNNWIAMLRSLSMDKFGQKVNDHDAVIASIDWLLQSVEQEYNQDNKVLLSDTNKRLPSSKINESYSKFVSFNRSYDFWRKHSDALSKRLDIKLSIRRQAETLLQNCFDYFKDLTQAEYRKIYKYVKERTDFDDNNNIDVDCILDLYNSYLDDFNPRLESHMVAYAVIAAYVETRYPDGKAEY